MIKKVDRVFYLFGKDGERHRLGKLGFITAADGTRSQIFYTHIKTPERHYYKMGRGYPINLELLRMLKMGGVNLVIVPEDGKTGFHCYGASVDQYLKGEMILEDKNDEQRCVPLEEMRLLSIDRDSLTGYIGM